MLRVKRKNSIQKFVVFLSLIVFITANVGMAVYTHTCSISGTEKSLFISYDDPCGDDHPIEKKSCCSKDETKELHFKKSCCSTDTEYVALDIDTRIEKSNVQIAFNLLPVAPVTNFNFYFSPELKITTQQQSRHSDFPPVRYQGRDFQSIHQVYRI